jgi:SAM-dependent methyltransferase
VNGIDRSPAEVYDRIMVPARMAPVVEVLLGRIALNPGERVLDLACGTGAAARRAADLVGAKGSVVGLDLNPAMLAVAQAGPHGARIVWKQGVAAELPFPDASFDVVLCQQGLQYFPDKPAALREVRRVLKPGGRLGASVWRSLDENESYRQLNDAIERHVGVPALAPAMSFGDDAALKATLDAAGFTNVTVETVKLMGRYPSPEIYVWATLIGASASIVNFPSIDGPDLQRLVDAIVRDLEAHHRPYMSAEGLLHPLATNIAIASA